MTISVDYRNSNLEDDRSQPRLLGLTISVLLAITNFVLPGIAYLVLRRYRRFAGTLVAWVFIDAAVVAALWTRLGLIGFFCVLASQLALPFAAFVDTLRLRTRRTELKPNWISIASVALYLMLGSTLNGLSISLLRGHLLEAFVTGSKAMSPTLNPGDRILVQKKLKVRRWDVIAFRHPQTSSTSLGRVVGLPGDTIEIRGGQLYVNGKIEAPPTALFAFAPLPAAPDRHTFAGPDSPLKLQADEYFELGDWSAVALDSRYFGALSQSQIIGVATAEYFPRRVSL